MSQSVDILIKADDKASQKVADAAVNVDKSLRRVEQITSSLESPTEKYNKQLDDLAMAHERGAISAEQFADAEARLLDKIKASESSLGKVSGSAKTAAAGFASLAHVAGGSEIAGFARDIGDVTNKIVELGEASKAGGMSAFAFKAGLVGLTASIAFGLGKAIADILWQTDKFERSMAKAKAQSAELDAQLKTMQSTMAANRREDIELIRDPDEKRAAHKQLLDELNRDINAVAGNVRASQKDVDRWAESWQITGNRKQYAADADAQLAADKEKLATLKAQRDEVEKLTGARAEENAAIKAANDAKDKSEDYLKNLQLEVEYLAATREEQIKLDALRNTTSEDRGEAERLLKERDAILAKAEAAKELEQAQKKAADEAAKAAEKASEDAAKEVQRVDDLIAAETERLTLQRIEIEQGKEAAKAQELMSKGVDAATARKLAAEEAALDLLKEQKDGKKTTSKGPENLQASESRLLTRGQGGNPMDETNRILRDVSSAIVTVATVSSDQLAAQNQIVANTSNATQLVGTT